MPFLDDLSPKQLEAYVQWLEVATWRFRGADLARVPVDPKDDTFTVGMVLELDKVKNQTKPTYAVLTVWNALTRDKPWRKPVLVAEKRLTEVKVPKEYLRPGTDLYVDLRCATPGHWLAARDDSVRLQQPPSWFVANLFKSELVILAELSLLVVIAVVASTRLGGWVALLTTGTAYLLGSIFSFVERVATTGGDSLFSAMDRRELEGTVVYQSLEGMQWISLKIVYFLVKVMPDFRIFEPLKFIADNRNMPWSVLVGTLLLAVLYALPCVALAYLLVRRQEVG